MTDSSSVGVMDSRSFMATVVSVRKGGGAARRYARRLHRRSLLQALDTLGHCNLHRFIVCNTVVEQVLFVRSDCILVRHMLPTWYVDIARCVDPYCNRQRKAYPPNCHSSPMISHQALLIALEQQRVVR